MANFSSQGGWCMLGGPMAPHLPPVLGQWGASHPSGRKQILWGIPGEEFHFRLLSRSQKVSNDLQKLLKHMTLHNSELILSVWLQVWGVLNRSTQAGHSQHPIKPWSVPHHGSLWHLLLHQYLQRGELSICQGPKGAIVGWHRRKCQGSAPKHLPWTHPPASPQYHRQHGSVRWAPHKDCVTFTHWPSACSFCVGQKCKPVIKLS